jgi:hypothetical protein
VRRVSLTFQLARDARVMFGREEGELADLKPGRRVRVFFDTEDGRRTVTMVQVVGPKPADAGDDKTITGTVERLAAKERQLVITGRVGKRGSEGEITLELPEGVKITRAGKPVKLEVLKEGTRVRIRHENRDGKVVAESIQVVDDSEDSFIKRVRRALQLADLMLRMVEKP